MENMRIWSDFVIGSLFGVKPMQRLSAVREGWYVIVTCGMETGKS
ncbi:MAG: hypothetical protein ACETVR_02000 [Candidatus Bathyarchaeia archaeon]